VKVVQRVPVLVSLEAKSKDSPPLRAGMTVTVRVDTGHERSLASAFRAAMR
jgi:membrane fusion protein, multidrug efflux system